VKGQALSISFSILFVPHLIEKNDFVAAPVKSKTEHFSTSRVDGLYSELGLSALGLSQKAFECAYKGYQYLAKKQRLSNTSVLSICDLSQSSNKKRLYIIDLANNRILLTSFVAHGKGSGAEFARRFSNSSRSHQSSLGFFITGSTYYGEHGLSLRLQGIEPGFNDHAVRRNIVVHGAEYIGNEYLKDNKFMGRSYGCPAVPQDESAEIIDLMKDGSCFFIYHPTRIYIQRSSILNG